MSTAPTIVKIKDSEVSLSLNVGRKIKGKQAGYDLGNLEDGPIQEMFIDPEVMMRTVWAVFSDRIEAAGVENETEFYDLVDSDLNTEISEAMKRAVADFFPWGQKLISRVERKLNDLDAIADSLEASGQLSGSSPES